MPTPFPGMDPYLEQRGVWEQVHTGLIVGIQRFLTPLLRPRYHVAIELRTYLSVLPPDDQLVGIPDAPPSATAGVAATPEAGILPLPAEVRERFLEIRTVDTREVVTVIEILSPSNKLSQEGRAQYERKRLQVLASPTNLVEIDLLRTGAPFAMQAPRQTDYRIVVSRSAQRPRADLYLFNVRQPIPDFPIPLRPGESEPVLPLNKLLHTFYDEGGYDLVLDYSQPPDPPLSADDVEWVRDVVAG
jgi:hypothetical protein